MYRHSCRKQQETGEIIRFSWNIGTRKMKQEKQVRAKSWKAHCIIYKGILCVSCRQQGTIQGRMCSHFCFRNYFSSSGMKKQGVIIEIVRRYFNNLGKILSDPGLKSWHWGYFGYPIDSILYEKWERTWVELSGLGNRLWCKSLR